MSKRCGSLEAKQLVIEPVNPFFLLRPIYLARLLGNKRRPLFPCGNDAYPQTLLHPAFDDRPSSNPPSSLPQPRIITRPPLLLTLVQSYLVRRSIKGGSVPFRATNSTPQPLPSDPFGPLVPHAAHCPVDPGCDVVISGTVTQFAFAHYRACPHVKGCGHRPTRCCPPAYKKRTRSSTTSTTPTPPVPPSLCYPDQTIRLANRAYSLAKSSR